MRMHYDKINITAEPTSIPKIRKIINKYIKKVSARNLHGEWIGIDPFAREAFTLHHPNFITNDLNPEFNTHYNLEFLEFADCLNTKPYFKHKEFQLVIFDPPYNLTLLKKHYDGIGKDLKRWQTWSMWGEGKDILARKMELGSYVISLGYHTHGFGLQRGFEKIAMYVFETYSREDQYNLFVTVEQKTQSTLDLQFEEIEEE